MIDLPSSVAVGWAVLILSWGQCRICPTTVAWWPWIPRLLTYLNPVHDQPAPPTPPPIKFAPCKTVRQQGNIWVDTIINVSVFCSRLDLYNSIAEKVITKYAALRKAYVHDLIRRIIQVSKADRWYLLVINEWFSTTEPKFGEVAQLNSCVIYCKLVVNLTSGE